MSNKIQIKKPSRTASRIKAANYETVQLSKEKLWVHLPKDMYLHTPAYNELFSPNGCQTEWWWHIGTLKSADGTRTFGFEINACALYKDGGGFTEVMLTDVEKQVHYHETKPGMVIPELWAESDPSKPWFVALENVLMKAPAGDPSQDMSVKATLNDGSTVVDFDLTLTQNGAPLYVFGNGTRLHKGQTEPSLGENNYYFSLPRLSVSGTIKIYHGKGQDPEIIEVAGVTWMDHEWGNFTDKNSAGKAQSVQWILQDMQLENGVCLSNFTLTPPTLNVPMASKATVQLEPGGQSYYVDTTMTATKSVEFEIPASVKGDPPTLKTYFTEIIVSIPEFGIDAVVTSSMSKQLLDGGIYEGVGTVIAVITPADGKGKETNVSGTAWVEQNIF